VSVARNQEESKAKRHMVKDVNNTNKNRERENRENKDD